MTYARALKLIAQEVFLVTLDALGEKGSEMVDKMSEADNPLDWFKFFYGDHPDEHSEMIARRQEVYDKLTRVKEAVPAIDSHKAQCPHDECDRASIFHLVILLNDTHEWSRREIADWLETLDADLTFPMPEGKEG